MKSRGLFTALLASTAACYATIFTFITFRRHDSFGSWALDMGNMDQAVWNTIHGRVLAFTNMEGITTRLAIHVEPTLVVISPVYLIWSDPKALLLLQTIALASGAFPLYWQARRELKSEAAALALAAGYLLFPSLEAVNYAEFHPVALSAPLLLWAFYFAEGNRWLGYYLTSLLAMGTKEEVGLVVATMAIYLAAKRRSPWPLPTAAMGIIWPLIAVLALIPAHNPQGVSPYTSYYEYLGDSLPDIAKSLLLHPWPALQKAIADPEYLASLLVPTAGLAILSPERLFVALPSFVLNILSDDAAMHRANSYHYSATLIPALMLATIRGVDRCRSAIERLGIPKPHALRTVMAIYILAAILYQRAEGLTPLSSDFSLPPITEHDMIGYQVLQQVPRDASLSVQSELNPHLSERERLYLFPEVSDAEYVLVDRWRDPNSPDPIGSPSQLQQHRLAVLQDLMRSGEYAVILDLDGYLLLRRVDTTRGSLGP